jgi:acyl-CoA thioesterase I
MRVMTLARILAALSAVLILVRPAPAEETSRLAAQLAAGKAQTIVTYGTSLTAGGAWVGQLRDALESKYPGLAKVINSGQGGMWSKWGVDNLDARVLQKKPDCVFIEFAINDAFLKYETPVEAARTNLCNMIDRILKSKPETEIVLMTMDPPVGVHLERRPKIEDYYQMYRDVAKERKLKLIDHEANWKQIVAHGQGLFAQLVPDGIHPSPAGCAKVITPEILKAMGLPVRVVGPVK